MSQLIRNYLENGFAKVVLENQKSLSSVKAQLVKFLKRRVNDNAATLETLHLYCDNAGFDSLQWDLCNFFWKDIPFHKIISDNIDMFTSLIGPDILYQKKPFLRIARPGVTSDNIGYHRDTMYGQSPYEVAVHVPLVDLSTRSALSFLAGSHTMPDGAFAVESEANMVEVKRGSKKHSMGFPYAPLVIKSEQALRPIPLKFGHVVIFTPSTVHGQTLNQAKQTRVSFDFRIISRFAPIEIKGEEMERGYAQVNKSCVTEIAEKFFLTNPKYQLKPKCK